MLAIVQQAVEEGRDDTWISERISASTLPDPFQDLLDSLQVVLDPPYTLQVQTALMVLVEPVLRQVLSQQLDLQTRIASLKALARAKSTIAAGMNPGPMRGTWLGEAANDLLTLALLGCEPTTNLDEAVRLYRRARTEGFASGTSNWASTLMNEGNALSELADAGHEPFENLARAVSLFGRSRTEGFEPNTLEWAASLTNEALALYSLARLGQAADSNLEDAVQLHHRARNEGLVAGTPDWAGSLMDEGSARHLLGRIGRDAVANLEAAALLFNRSRMEGFEFGTLDWATALMNEGNVLQTLARSGREPVANLQQALQLYKQAQKEGFDPGTLGWSRCLLNEANARHTLADMGREPITNLELSVSLCERSRREGFEAGTPPWALALMNEGNARKSLAGLGWEQIANIERAVSLFGRSRREGFEPGTPDWASSLLNESNANLLLADMSESPTQVLEQAVSLSARSRLEGFDSGTPTWALALINEGNARASLARLDQAPIANIEQAVSLFQRSREEGLEFGTPDWARSLMNEGIAYECLYDLPRARASYGRAHAEGAVAGTADWLMAASFFASVQDVPEKKLELLQRAVDTTERLRTLNSKGLHRSEFQERYAELYGSLCLTLFELGRNDEAWEIALQAKNRTIFEEIEEDLPQPGPTPDRRRLYRELRDLAVQIQQVEAQPGLAAGTSSVGDLRTRYVELDCLYRPELSTDNGFALDRALRAVAGLGNGQGVFVEFVLSDKGILAFRVELGDPTQRTVQFLETGETPSRVVQGMYASLEAIADKDSDPPYRDAARLEVAKSFPVIGQWFQQIEGWLPTDGAPLILSPHGLLSLLPLAAAEWDEKRLIERCPVVILPSAILAELIQERTVEPVPKGVGIFAHAGPSDNRIPLVHEETRGVAKALELSNPPEQNTTAAEFRVGAADKGVLHISCHGMFNRVDPLESVLLFDEPVTAREIAAMDLSQSDFVFLSACEAGGAAARRIDSFAGLSHAFFRAGVPSIVAPLWFVWDKPSLYFAERLYEEWTKPGTPLYLAFQRAMIAHMRHDCQHLPDAWSPWQLIGGWNVCLR